MATPPVSDEEMERTVAAFEAAGRNQVQAAAALGISRGALQDRLRKVAKTGLLGSRAVLPGFAIRQTSEQIGPDGELQRQWIKQAPEPGEPFTVPDGHVVKAVSALTDADGRVMQQWVKTRQGEPDPLETAEIIKRAFEDWTPAAPAIITPESDNDRLTVYILADWHVGLFAWGRETGGPDWDLTIAQSVLMDAMREIVDQSPRSSHAVVLGLGDLLHADNSRNQTERSGNVLDVDTRHAKCLETVCDLVAASCEMVASKHAHVSAAFKPGNHDTNSTAGITQAIRMYFRSIPTFDVDTSPDPFYWKRFGVNLIGGTHGDKAKIPELPLIMANRRKEDWAASSTRHFHTGHIHHDTLRETGGVHVYSHRAPVAQDAYHASMGYLSGRSMKSYAYHAERGSKGHSEVEIK